MFKLYYDIKFWREEFYDDVIGLVCPFVVVYVDGVTVVLVKKYRAKRGLIIFDTAYMDRLGRHYAGKTGRKSCLEYIVS